MASDKKFVDFVVDQIENAGEINDDCSHWTVYHEIYNQYNQKVAHITAKGTWMNVEKRKLTIPPEDLAKAFHELPIGEDYVYKKSIKVK